MWHAGVWGLVGLGLALWSLLCWASHAVLSWDGWARGLDWATQAPAIELPAWVAGLFGLEWVQWLQAALVDMGPTLRAWLADLPAMGGFVTLAAWVVWALGTALLLGLGVLGSTAVALARRAARRVQPAVA